MKKKRKHGFDIDMQKLEAMCLEVYDAAQGRRRIFHGGLEKYLPQFNLPAELEHFPRKEETKDPYTASLYLWTVVFFERINQSRIIMKNAYKLWADPKNNWIFFPEKVVSHGLEEISHVLKKGFQFNLQSTNEEPPADRFLFNQNLLIQAYGSDPRNLLIYKTVEEARNHLQRFKGIGSGIANLYITYLIDRKISSPLDPENALLKVDIHKGRIPINTGAVTPVNGEIARDDNFVSTLENAYSAICKKNNLNPGLLDAALWIVGSEGCRINNYFHCSHNCPIYTSCQGNTPESKDTGRYIVLTTKGRRVDSRRGKDQLVFKFD